jgi:NADH:ubiquinone oxidoreductase subunit C
MKDLEERLRGQYGDGILEFSIPAKRRVYLKVDSSVVKEVANLVKEYGFDMPISAGATDYMKEKRFEVFWVLWSTKYKSVLILKTDVDREDPEIESLVDVWRGVQKFERETWELMGINYIGHPKLRPLLLPDDWDEGYPLRKDFSLKPYKV